MPDIATPELEVRDRDSRARLVSKTRDGFPYSLWVPTLRSIGTAATMGEQHQAIAVAGINTAVARDSFRVHGKKARFSHRSTELRYRLVEDEDSIDPRLVFLRTRIGSMCIAYQTPDTATPRPAFAVVDVPSESYHRVVLSPDDKVTELEVEIGQVIQDDMAACLHDKYPGFEIHRQLADPH